jgi:hypothetical protein
MSEPSATPTVALPVVDPVTGEVRVEPERNAGLAGSELALKKWLDDQFIQIRDTLKKCVDTLRGLSERISTLENGITPQIDPDFERWLDRFVWDHYITQTQAGWIRNNRALNERFRALHVAAKHAFSPKAGPYDRVNWWSYMETAVNRLKMWEDYRNGWEEQPEEIQEAQREAANRWNRPPTRRDSTETNTTNTAAADTGQDTGGRQVPEMLPEARDSSWG